MEKDVAVREWCLEKALVVNHLNSEKTLDIARQFEAYILDKREPLFAVYPPTDRPNTTVKII